MCGIQSLEGALTSFSLVDRDSNEVSKVETDFPGALSDSQTLSPANTTVHLREQARKQAGRWTDRDDTPPTHYVH